MIAFSHVYKTYPNGHHALRNIQFEVEKGEFVFLTGPSGAGKSTLFRLLTCHDQATSGQVSVKGQNLSNLSKNKIPFYRRKLGMVFQDFKLLNEQTVFDNVTLPLKLAGLEIKKSNIMQLLEEVGLEKKWDDYPIHLSGGEQQRTAIARALVHQPELLIADEPTGNLDPQLSEEIISLFEMASARGTTILIATHDHPMVERKMKRRIQIQAGELIQPKDAHADL